MAATIKDIKAETGLGLATISKYLNGGHVRPENKEKIEAAIEKLHYLPNAMARGLVTKRTMTIGFIAHHVGSVFDGELIHYAGELLRKEGYGLLICDSDGDEELERQNILFMLEKKVDGFLIVSVAEKPDFLQPALDAGVPFVLVDREINGGAFDSVTINNRESAEMAVQYLIDHGHRQIAVIGSEREYTGYERIAGYECAMRRAGLSIPEEYLCIKEVFSTEMGYQQMRKLMELPNCPTAVFMCNYEADLGGVIAVNEMNIECPKDISLIGFDDLLLTGIMRPPLAVVEQPTREIVEEAVRILMKRIAEGKPDAPQRVQLFAKFKEGGSVRSITE